MNRVMSTGGMLEDGQFGERGEKQRNVWSGV
jgi:hypothetical protein